MVRSECFEHFIRYLPAKEKDLIKWYVKLGMKKEAAIRAGYPESTAQAVAAKILRKTAARKYIKSIMTAAGHKIGWEFEDKLRKLRHVADLAIPDEAKTMDELTPTAGIAAIAESNKMQGHYSAEKVVQTNVNVDVDLQQVKELMDKYKRDY